MFDAELYREKAEVERWKQRDPLTLAKERIVANAGVSQALFEALETSVVDEVALATQFAESGSWEPVEQLLSDVYPPRDPPRVVATP